jgi:uncharacterized protein
VTVHRLSQRDARRIAVRAQLLDRDRPTELVEMVRRLAVVQNDLTAAVAPNADLVAWSRLGAACAPGDIGAALAAGSLVELQGLVLPAEDIALHLADMTAWPGTGADVPAWRDAQAEWVDANDAFRWDILDRLEREGPLTWRELPDTATVAWKSSGWNTNRNVAMMLEFLVASGQVASTGVLRGRDRLWDLPERVYPNVTPIPSDQARRIRDERRLQALGIARAKTTETPLEPNDVGPAGEPAVIDGVPGEWRVDPEQLDRPFAGRAAVISPLDRLVYDRKRMTELFAFDYQLEMYKPAAKRQWGYFALPVLYGDRLIGKVDATADRKAGLLRVAAVHEDVPFNATTRNAVDREIAGLADWLGLRLHRV